MEEEVSDTIQWGGGGGASGKGIITKFHGIT